MSTKVAVISFAKVAFSYNRSDRYLNDKFQFIRISLFKEGMYTKWCVEVSRDSVVHDDKLTFGWSDFECLVKLKLGIVDALVKVEVVEHDLATSGVAGDYYVLIQHQL
jgi:hypothetical protein